MKAPGKATCAPALCPLWVEGVADLDVRNEGAMLPFTDLSVDVALGGIVLPRALHSLLL